MKNRYYELKKKADSDYKEILMKYNEQDKKLTELQSLSNNIQNDLVKNTSTIRSKNKFNTNDIIKTKTYEDDNKIINNNNNMDNINNINNDSFNKNNVNNQNKKKIISIINISKEKDNPNGGKIFDNSEQNSTPFGNESINKNQKENNKKTENINNDNINKNNNDFENSEIIQSKNIFISNIDQEKNKKLKALDNNNMRNQNVLNSININNNKKNEIIPSTLSKFGKAFEERDENYRGIEDDYNKITIPEK